MTLSQEVLAAGQEIISATEATLPDTLNRILGQFLRWPLKATTRRLVDLDNNRTERFASVVYAAAGDATPETNDVRADNAAAIIDAHESLDMETFHAAYGRITHAKRLRKSPTPSLEGFSVQTTTLGIIFALRSTVPLEHIADELNRLNAETPSREWPDMIAVGSTGVINYVVQFPGESVTGGWLPPAERRGDTQSPPTYVIIAMTPTGAYTFNKVLALPIAQIVFFSPGVQVTDTAQIQEGVRKETVVISGYQYDLSGELRPVLRQFYSDRYLPPLPMRIEDGRGTLLCTLQFIPWQDGA